MDLGGGRIVKKVTKKRVPATVATTQLTLAHGVVRLGLGRGGVHHCPLPSSLLPPPPPAPP
eukprot:COSAG06_NODE_66205_length_255_cov_0.570513_1_plen_60_part_10